MKKINFIKSIALSVSALMVFSFSGCDYLSKLIDGAKDGNDSNVTDDDKNSTKPELTISQTEVTLSVGDEVQLTAASTDGSSVTWGVSPAGVVTVADGLVTGVAAGEATVWASTESLMVTCTVKVNPVQVKPDPPTGETLELSDKILSLEVGASATLTATCSIKDATVKWASSSPSVATVSNGKVTGKAKGSTTISASVDLPAGDKLTATCSVSVTTPAGSDKDGYKLVWFDEFNGTSLDTSKWGYQTGTQDHYGSSTGPDYWGNAELQYYTEDAVSVSGGMLKITATKQQAGDRPYTSGRILTRDKANWTYGYFEARMQTPTGNGMWPAFWMLPQPSSKANSDNVYGGWPMNGEIDIMEAKGRLGNIIDTTIHFGKVWPENQHITNSTYCGYPTDGYALSSATDNWHTYAVNWTQSSITWYADGVEVFKLTNDRWWTPSSAAASAPFDQPFYILLNLAVGGNYDGDIAPDHATFTSKSMYVDYVRVYEKL